MAWFVYFLLRWRPDVIGWRPDWIPDPDKNEGMVKHGDSPDRSDDTYFRPERVLIIKALRAYKWDSNRQKALVALEMAECLPGNPADKFDWEGLEAEVERRGGDWTAADLIAEGWPGKKAPEPKK